MAEDDYVETGWWITPYENYAMFKEVGNHKWNDKPIVLLDDNHIKNILNRFNGCTTSNRKQAVAISFVYKEAKNRGIDIDFKINYAD